jgi:hypothetical protein
MGGYKMTANIGSQVHPRYKGINEWEIKAIAELPQPLKWSDKYFGGEVTQSPRLLMLGSPKIRKALWLAYWMATPRTKSKLAWGGAPPVLEEDTFLELMKTAVKQGFFTRDSLNQLKREIEAELRE